MQLSDTEIEVGNLVIQRVLKLWASGVRSHKSKTQFTKVQQLGEISLSSNAWGDVVMQSPDGLVRLNARHQFHDPAMIEYIDVDYCVKVVIPTLDRCLVLHDLSEV
jgi:hypothetical protein